MPENVAPKLTESHLVEDEMPVRSAPLAAAKQHYAIDIADGVAVAAACFGLVRLCLRFRMWANRQKALEGAARRRGRPRDEQVGQQTYRRHSCNLGEHALGRWASVRAVPDREDA